MMSLGLMFISMFIIQYFFMSYIMTNRMDNMQNSFGKVYMSSIMGLFMVLLMVFMKRKINMTHVILFTSLLLLIIYLYKEQVGINDKEYLKEMVEHHSMAVLTSKQILNKTNNITVSNFAKQVLNTQEREINEMKHMIKSI